MDAMRPIHLTARLASGTALGIVLAAAMALTPARAADDVPADIGLLQGLLEGIGLRSPDKPVIQYQERAPLAIPQGDTLPPPQAPGAAVANNPAWPKDADRARAKLEKERQRNRDTSWEIEESQRALRPSELEPGRGTVRVRTQRPNDPVANASVGADGRETLSPSELGYKGGLFSNFFGKGDDEKAVSFTGEPPRTSLTQPPQGYQTPSPDQPYGLGKQNAKAKAIDYYTTHGEDKR
jgi:hypothetical protein